MWVVAPRLPATVARLACDRKLASARHRMQREVSAVVLHALVPLHIVNVSREEECGFLLTLELVFCESAFLSVPSCCALFG